MKSKGVLIERLCKSAEAKGLRAGDLLLFVNGGPVSDEIDYAFHKGGEGVEITFERKGKTHSISFDETPDIELRPFPIKRCRNRCVFCFVEQLPRGLRKTLYVKDEDYRMSFLYGNYITMTNLSDADRNRIAEQRLSPLYISVHSTRNSLRNKLLGISKSTDIMKDLLFLKKNKIRMHTQIVLCPGLNDGEELKKTLADLCSLYPYVSSVAIVPVGLTAHRKNPLRAVGKEDAERAIEAIEAFQRRMYKRHGDRVVYGADELYLKAERTLPPLKEYGELPQIENGVGMVSQFLSRARKIKPTAKKGRFLTFTGVSFYPFLKRFLEKISGDALTITPVKVENTFFGSSVTVAGLLTGRDVMRAVGEFLEKEAVPYDALLIPDCVLRDAKDVFLDDVSPSDIESYTGIKVKVVEATPDGLLNSLSEK